MIKIHATDLREFYSCRRKFFYQQIERLKPKANSDPNYQKPDYFVFGTEGHRVLGAHYRGDDVDKVIDSIENQDHRDFIRTLYTYYKPHYEEEDKNKQTATVEQTLSFEFEGIQIEFTMDWCYLDKIYTVMDHKFYEKMPSIIDMEWEFQASFYPWAGKKVGIDIQAFVLNVIRKGYPEMPRLLKTGERKGMLSNSASQLEVCDYETYLSAIKGYGLREEDYEKELLALKQRGSSVFRRFPPVRRTPGQLRSFEENLKTVIEEIKREPKYFVPTWSTMNCPKCVFKSLCRAQDSDADYEFTKKSLYEVKDETER